jgi:hypothetical protein
MGGRNQLRGDGLRASGGYRTASRIPVTGGNAVFAIGHRKSRRFAYAVHETTVSEGAHRDLLRRAPRLSYWNGYRPEDGGSVEAQKYPDD